MVKVRTEIRVERYNWKRRGRELYGYLEDQGSYQLLVKRWKLGRFTVWKRVLDREEIPMHALIEAGALGFTTWRSKFAEFIR